MPRSNDAPSRSRSGQAALLPREEYVEQAFFFEMLRERIGQSSAQELLGMIRHELLATTKMPMAVDFLAGELRLTGGFASGMKRLSHYFTPFQAYVIEAAEDELGRMDFGIGLEILQKEASYRAEDAPPQGLFFYQFETLCRNRLSYDRGLDAMALDPVYDEGWRAWLRTVQRQIGLVEFADMIFVRSAAYERKPGEADAAVLFGEREGRIAKANRCKDPVYLFSALARHLGYPEVPRPRREAEPESQIPSLVRHVEQLEQRLQLLEEERRGGIDLSRFYYQDKKGGPAPSE